MALSVRRLSREMVRPYEPNTPTAPLNLSVIDRMPMLRFDVRTLLVFKDGHETSAKSVREALSKALVPYYPLAGRLQESSDDGLHISCTGGVWFVEAFADCTLDAVSYLDKATLVTQENLLPDSIPEDDDQTKGLDPILQMQVTNFKCGGFVLGLIFSHSVCDATGISQFLNAVGEFARGLESPSVNPVWFREIIPSPSLVKEAPLMLPTPPLMPHYQLKQASFDVDAHKLDQLKRELSNSIGKTCSTFEVLTAGIWRSRTRAINLNKSSINVKLVFYANISHLLNPPPPRGFYGNSIFPVTISVSSGWLVEASLAEIVQIIKEAKAKLPTEFNKWIDGKGGGDDPFVVPLDYTTLSISDWTKLGLKDVDLGWGCPVHVVPVEIPVEIMTIQPFGFPCLPPKPRTGIRFMTWCVEESHLPSFLDQMMNLYAALN